MQEQENLTEDDTIQSQHGELKLFQKEMDQAVLLMMNYLSKK